VEAMQLSLSSLGDVLRFFVEFKAKYQRLDVLINNAGVGFCGNYLWRELKVDTPHIAIAKQKAGFN
jgi:NAD(P)-dependent dehydrogenase (short-subunit alcohol dehydrogenase family)